MVRRLKWIRYFILLASALLFGLVLCSQKANALDISTSVVPTGYIRGRQNVRCVFDYNIVVNGTAEQGECIYNPNGNQFDRLTSIYNNTNMNVKTGDIFEFFVFFKSLNNIKDITWTIDTDEWFSLLNYEKISEDQYYDFCRSYQQSGQINYSCTMVNNSWSNGYKITIMANQDKNNVKIGIGNSTTTLWLQTLTSFNVFMSDIVIYKSSDSVSEIMEQDKTEGQQQGQQGNSDSEQAGQDVEGSTQNMLSAITGFFGAFTSASATTCQTDWGIEGFRNFDFCGTQVPVELQIVFTIVASIIFIPMILFLINSILGAFKEFQE